LAQVVLVELLVEHLVEQAMVFKVEIQPLAWLLQPQLAADMEFVAVLLTVALVVLAVAVLVAVITALELLVKEIMVVAAQTIQAQRV
jgi:hypothetical protein